jgi:GNAT superfamily N-acetyltransferase
MIGLFYLGGIMTINIRKGTQADFPAILELIKDLATYEKSSDKVKVSVEQMKKEKKFFDSFVAEEDGMLVGIAVYFFSYSTWVGKGLYLEDLYVRPELRGKRVGTKLLVKIFELAKKEGCNRVRWQVLDWNRDAIVFYKKRGARISDEWLNCDFDGDQIGKFLGNNSG